MSQSLPKEVPDKCSISGHGSLNSISRHSSLKSRMDSPQIRKAVTAGRSKSFNNHRPMDPEVIAQVSSTFCWTALLEGCRRMWGAGGVGCQVWFNLVLDSCG